MASKVELEAEVERLRAELADKSASPEQVDADVTSLKEELDRVVDERDALRTQTAQLKAQLDATQKDLTVARDSLELARKGGGSCSGDHTMVEGVKYPIVYRQMLKEFVNDFFKKMTPHEDFTVLVIPKIGG